MFRTRRSASVGYKQFPEARTARNASPHPLGLLLRVVLVALACGCSVEPLKSSPPPVIDMHLHPSMWDTVEPRSLREAMDSLNVRYVVHSGDAEGLAAWQHGDPALADRLIPSLMFPCRQGHVVMGRRRCFPDGGDYPDLGWLRGEVEGGRIRGLGEITAQYSGIAPDDPRLEPYFALAEEYDLPVGIHLGLAPSGAAYPDDGAGPAYLAAAGRPLLLESVLLRHPRLRIWVMHAGWPLLDEMIYVMRTHERVYVDLGVLHWALPRPAFESALRRLVEAGCTPRIMYGTDGGLEQLAAGIDAVLRVPFLSADEKRAILHDNAARFLGLGSPPPKD